MKRIQFPDATLMQLQSNVEEAIQTSTNAPIIGGSLLTSIVVTPGGTQVAHKLGRQLQGYMVVRSNANAVIWDTAADDKFVTLMSTATCTVTLWVF